MAWFKSWFNSPWYHLLYEHRDEKDAEIFLDALLTRLKPSSGASILDLGCGRGRHSVYLNQKGYTVTGLDLSPESIAHCSQFENETLSFFVHDMRHLFRVNAFDYVFNLFTSFGYFDTDREHAAVIQNAALALKPEGVLILDFLNPGYVRKHLKPSEQIERSGIRFQITKKCENGVFTKEIQFEHQGKPYSFTEQVAALEHDDFERYFSSCGLQLKNTYGDYCLEPWDRVTSPRMIFECFKTT